MKFSFLLFFFIVSPLFARWSAVEKIDIQDVIGFEEALTRNSCLQVDVFDNKHIGYVTQSITKGAPCGWHYGYKARQYIYNQWVDTILYTHSDQMPFPPHSKPVVATDNQGRCHFAWSYIDEPTSYGWVYYRLRDSSGVWDPLLEVSPDSVDRGGNLAIAVSSGGIRRVIVYTVWEAGAWRAKLTITTDDGNNWTKGIDVKSLFDENAILSVAIDGSGYIYVLYQRAGLRCQLRSPDGQNEEWEYNLGGILGRCCTDPVTGNVHFVNIDNGNVIYRYRVNGNTGQANWHGVDTLLTNSTSNLVSISAYNDIVGIVSGLASQEDTLYLKKEGGVWDTVGLPRIGTKVYAGKCISIDTGGYAHILGNVEVSGGTAIGSDSIFYFTDRIIQKVIILPDTIVIPDTGGTTYPGVPIVYPHRIINKGNAVDTFGLYISRTKIDSIAALIYNGDTAWYSMAPGTLFVNGLWPEDTAVCSLLIIPSDTCRPCFLDSTEFIAYSCIDPTIRDSALDTTHVIIDVILSKSADPQSGNVNPLDTITYTIIFADTWQVHIDSIIIYDVIDSDLDTVWVESTTAISDTYYFAQDTLVWIIWDQRPPRTTDTLIFKGIVKPFDCNTSFPVEIRNFASTPGTPCISPTTSDMVIHNATIGAIGLRLIKIPELDHPEYDTLNPGDPITYYIECWNDSSSPAKNVIIEDLLDDDVIKVTYASNSPIITQDYVRWSVDCILGYTAYYCTLTCIVGYEYKGVYERLDTLNNIVMAYGPDVIDTAYSDTLTHYIYRKIDVYDKKSAIPKSDTIVARGDTILYTVTFWNDISANSIMRNVKIIDTLHPLISEAINITGNYTYTHPVITWTIDSLAPGDTFSESYRGIVSLDAPFGDTVFNWFRIIYSDVIDISSKDTTIHIIGKAELNLIKSADSVDYDTLLPGQSFSYYLQCTNIGEIPAKNVVVKDILDDDVIEVTYVNNPGDIIFSNTDSVGWQINELLPDSSYYCTLTVTIGYEYKREITRLDTLDNWAITYADTIWTPDSSVDSTVHYIFRKLDIYGKKSANPPHKSMIVPGDSILYILTFWNDISANSIMRDIIIIDTLHPYIDTAKYITGNYTYTHPVITWTIDSLAPGDSFVGTYWGFVDSGAPIGDSVLNHFWFIYPEIIDSLSNTTVHYLGREGFRKSANPPKESWVAPGEIIHYTLTYWSLHHDTVFVTIVDTVDLVHLDILSISPPDSSIVGNIITWNIGGVAPKETVTVWYDAQVKIDAPLGDTIPNTGVFQGIDTGSAYTEHYIGTHIPVIQKFSDPDSGRIVRPGDTIAYELRCYNGGNLPGINVVVIDTVNNVDNAFTIDISRGSDVWSNVGVTWMLEWTIDTLFPGASEWITYKAIVTEKPGDSVVNFANVEDAIISNKTIHYIEVPGLRLDKDAYLPYPDRSIVSPGDTISYYIVLENPGGDTAHGVIVYDLIDTTLIDTCINIIPEPYRYTVDSIIWDTLGDLPPLWRDTLKYQGIIKTNAPADTIINLCFGSGIDTDTVRDTTFHFITLKKERKWAIPASETWVRQGTEIEFLLSYIGGTIDTQVTIVDTVDPLLSAPYAWSTGGVWDPIFRTMRWDITVSPNSVDTVWFKARVLPTAPVGDTVYNYGIFQSLAGTMIAGPTKHPIVMPYVSIEKTATPPSGAPVTVGDTITYTIRCSNYGTDTAKGIIVHDTLSEYFVSPEVIIWNVGDIPPNAVRDTTFSKNIRLELPPTAWGDTIFNIPVLFSPVDEDVDTVKDTTYHIIKKTSLNIVKRSFDTLGNVIPEFSLVYPDTQLDYRIVITNIGEVPAKDLFITDTIRNLTECVKINSILMSEGLDTVWISPLFPNVVEGKTERLDPGNAIKLEFRVQIIGEEKGIVTDTLDTLMNTCCAIGKNAADSSATHTLYVAYNCGVEIYPPDTSINIFANEVKVCTLRVKNIGSFKDSIALRGKNLAPGWQIFLGGTMDSSYLFPDVPRDSVRLLPVKIVAPEYESSNTALVIARSLRSERIDKIVEDTTIIKVNSTLRIVNIIVEPDTTSEVAPNETKKYEYIRVINRGNDVDVVEIDVEKPDNGWTYTLTHKNGTPLQDTDGDTKIDVGPVYPNETKELLLKLTPPDIVVGFDVLPTDTLVIWGTSSHGAPPDTIISLRDSACAITELKIFKYSIHNYPNPFIKTKGTTFVIILPKKSKCSLTIYTRKGEVVKRVFVDEEFSVPPVRHDRRWDARNEGGKLVAAGVYIYKFECEGRPPIIKKLVVLPSRH